MRSLLWLVALAGCGAVKGTPADAPPGFSTLTVEVTGTGRVTSTPAGIDCPGTCSASFEPGTEVTLAASASSPIVFTGWSSGCTPSRFDCTLTLDSDIDVGAGFAMQGTKRWLMTAGSAGVSSEVRGVGSSGGPIAVVGRVSSPTMVGGRTATGGMFIAQLDSATGQAQWLTNIAGPTGMEIAVDPAGDVAIGGFFSGMANFGAGNLASVGGSTDAFVAKYSGSDGSHVWSKGVGADHFDFGTALAMAPNGDVVLGGSFSRVVDFGDGPRTSAGGDTDDVFVTRYAAADGAQLWTKTFGNADNEQLYGVHVDPNGSVGMAGTFTGNLQLGVTFMQSGMSSDAFVGKLDGASGNVLLGKDSNGTGSDSASRVATDSEGSLVFGGFYAPPTDFGGTTLPAGISYVAKFTTAGSHVWSRGINANLERIVIDSFGDIVIIGIFQNTLDLGNGVTLSASGVFDVFVAKLEPGTGATRWAKRFGGGQSDTGLGLAVDAVDRIYVSGVFAGFAEFDDETPTSVGTQDLFVISLEP